MEKKFYLTNEFKSLSKEWDQKLESEGLGDVEKSLDGGRVLRQRSSNVYRQMDRTTIEAKEIYFQQLNSCLQAADFDSEIDKIVMSLKAQGAKIIEICAYLTEIGKSRYRKTVRLIIRKYEDRWGIRIWRPEQLNYYRKRHPKKRQPIR